MVVVTVAQQCVKLVLAAVWRMRCGELRMEQGDQLGSYSGIQEREDGGLNKGGNKGDEKTWSILPRAALSAVLSAVRI